jgi:hypothetical protein
MPFRLTALKGSNYYVLIHIALFQAKSGYFGDIAFKSSVAKLANHTLFRILRFAWEGGATNKSLHVAFFLIAP